MFTQTCTCPICHRTHIVKAPFEGYDDWLLVEAAHQETPDLSDFQFNALTSKICPNCKRSVYGVETGELEEEDELAGYNPNDFRSDSFYFG